MKQIKKYLKHPSWYWAYMVGLLTGALYQILNNINIYTYILSILIIIINYFILLKINKKE